MTKLLILQGLVTLGINYNGSSLITKAEFDSLKNNFQSQLDSYNTSIDSRIDIAIASYSGVDKTYSGNMGTKTTFETSKIEVLKKD